MTFRRQVDETSLERACTTTRVDCFLSECRVKACVWLMSFTASSRMAQGKLNSVSRI